MSLHKHTEDCAKLPLVRSAAQSLAKSLEKRFKGIFQLLTRTVPSSPTPYYDMLYLASTVLDPAFGLVWVEDVAKDVRAGVVSDIAGKHFIFLISFSP